MLNIQLMLSLCTNLRGNTLTNALRSYAANHISAESAWKLAFYRGLCAAEVEEKNQPNGQKNSNCGSMMAVGLPKEDLDGMLSVVNQDKVSYGVSIACHNSPRNVTLAGEDRLIDRLKNQLDQENIFARKLRVNVAYHSDQMRGAAAKYQSMIGTLVRPSKTCEPTQMISSVTGRVLKPCQLLEASYWARNMVEPVQFETSVEVMCLGSSVSKKTEPCIDHIIEIGPHAALKGPVREILRAKSLDGDITYSSTLKRGESSHRTVLQAMGELHCKGAKLNLEAVNEASESTESMRKFLVDLPEYVFDHTKKYWYESRLSQAYRFRENAPSEFLGVQCKDWNPFEPRWRNFIRSSEMPWVADHMVSGNVLYPAAGMLVMILEAVRQLTTEGQCIRGYTFRNVCIESPIDLTANGGCVEVQTSLHNPSISTNGRFSYTFRIQSHSTLRNEWISNCLGSIIVEMQREGDAWSTRKTQEQRNCLAEPFEAILAQQTGNDVDATSMYKLLQECGLYFGPHFQVAQRQRYDAGRNHSTAEIELLESTSSGLILHPTCLDAMFQLVLTAVTSGGSRAIATTVPSHIESLWVSGTTRQDRQGKEATQKLKACTAVEQMKSRGFTCMGIACDTSDGSQQVVVTYKGLTMTNISKTPASNPPEATMSHCIRVQCKPALNMLDTNGICNLLEHMHPSEPSNQKLWQDLEMVVDLALGKLIQNVECPSDEIREWKPWKQHYWDWVEYHVSDRKHSKRPGDHIDITEISHRLRNGSKVGRLVVTVASNIIDLFNEDISPLETLLQSGILKDYYEELNSHSTTAQMRSYLDLLSHQKPGLTLLEIGGGTGGGTRNFLLGLSNPGDEQSSLRCNRYDFTDISPTLVDSARQEFHCFHRQMTFGTLDMEQDYLSQGFSDGQYDVVLAVQALHITSDLRATLQRLRKSLKAGGKLIFQESLTPSGWLLGFVFGLFPGWWLGVGDRRLLSPSLDLESWNILLQDTGFSGIEIVRDYGKEMHNHVGWIVSTAVDETQINDSVSQTSAACQLARTSLVVEGGSLSQQELAQAFASDWKQTTGACEIVSMGKDYGFGRSSIPALGTGSEIIIWLAPYERSFFSQLDERGWEDLQSLVKSSRRLLLVTSGGGHSTLPEYGMLEGFARTLRQENPERQIVILALDATERVALQYAALAKTATGMLSKAIHEQYEDEYAMLNGILHTRRMVVDYELQDSVSRRLVPYNTVSTSCDGQVRFQISCQQTEADALLHYVQLPMNDIGPTSDDIEILVKSVRLGPQDQFPAASAVNTIDQAVRYVSGVVVNAGSNSEYKPGDRIFAVTSGTAISSHVIVASQDVISIEGVDFTVACSEIPPLASAFDVLSQGDVKPDDTVLIHNGANSIGQAAILSLLGRGYTNLWATVSNEDESRTLFERCKLPYDRILLVSWLEEESALASQWVHKFEKSILTGKPQAGYSLSSVKPGGQVIMLCTGPSTLENSVTNSDVSAVVIDLNKLKPSRAALRHASEVLQAGLIVAATNKVFLASALSDAVDELGKLQPHEFVFLNFDDDVIVDVRKYKGTEIRTGIQETTLLDPNATYLIAGGLGGLGRAVARWMVRHGARCLMLLSRYGPKADLALEMLAELRGQGIRVETPCCDISNRKSLATTLRNVGDLPPFKGCIQASMVMKVRRLV